MKKYLACVYNLSYTLLSLQFSNHGDRVADIVVPRRKERVFQLLHE